MIRIYLWASAALYALFAIWCTLAPERTSRAAGYLGLDAGGRSEYVVVYGGLQFGLGVFFAWLALRGHEGIGLVFALCITSPIVALRLLTVARNWPVPTVTLWLAALELALLAVAIALWVWQRPAG
jgi:hypothetical protein